jgi:2-polyprenyl-6-methoxyphenol hydroxylase-like FAD-dependent oxidoreductase
MFNPVGMTAKLNIAMAGCGIGGLAAATLLAAHGHHVRIYDRFHKPAPVGSGLVIQPVGQMVLAATGALAHAQELGNPITCLTGCTAPNNRLVLDVSYGEDRVGLAIHRASLFTALLDVALRAGSELCSDACVTHCVLNGPDRFLYFSDGRKEGPFDLVIDATGARSPLSPLVNHQLPYGALWATVNWPEKTSLPRHHLTQKYHRASTMAGVLPIGRMPDSDAAKAAIFWSLKHTDLAAWRETPLNEWKNEACAHWPEFAPFVDQVTGHDAFTMAVYSHGTLKNPISDRLVHIGDAAHTASPQLGQGANMALLDAFALAAALNKFDLTQALETYRSARRNHTRIYQASSHLFTPLYQSDGEALPFIRDHILAPITRLPPMQYLLARLVSGDFVPPVQAGLTPD